MVTVRLARFGSKKRPYYHIVVTDRENPRDGRFIEQIGTYNPKAPDESSTHLKRERLNYWLGMGAQLSERASKVLRNLTKAEAAAAAAPAQG